MIFISIDYFRVRNQRQQLLVAHSLLLHLSNHCDKKPIVCKKKGIKNWKQKFARMANPKKFWIQLPMSQTTEIMTWKIGNHRFVAHTAENIRSGFAFTSVTWNIYTPNIENSRSSIRWCHPMLYNMYLVQMALIGNLMPAYLVKLAKSNTRR